MQLLVEAGASARVIQNKAQAIYKDTIAEENRSKGLISTNKQGNVIANKQFLSTIIIKYAGMVLDLGRARLPSLDDKKWSRLSDLVHQNLYFSPVELLDGYIGKYLGKVIKDTRHHWYAFYKDSREEASEVQA